VTELEKVMRVAQFRVELRRFLHHHEQISRAGGLTPQRYLLLLLVKGAPDGSERARLTDLADRLLLDRTTVTELVARTEAAGLLEREGSPDDRRSVYVRLTAEGERRLAHVLEATEEERRALAAAFRELARTFRATAV
jgi:DNA-binding MarR family transcriptional regulator